MKFTDILSGFSTKFVSIITFTRKCVFYLVWMCTCNAIENLNSTWKFLWLSHRLCVTSPEYETLSNRERRINYRKRMGKASVGTTQLSRVCFSTSNLLGRSVIRPSTPAVQKSYKAFKYYKPTNPTRESRAQVLVYIIHCVLVRGTSATIQYASRRGGYISIFNIIYGVFLNIFTPF